MTRYEYVKSVGLEMYVSPDCADEEASETFIGMIDTLAKCFNRTWEDEGDD